MSLLKEKKILQILFIMLFIATFLGGFREGSDTDYLRVLRIITLSLIFFTTCLLIMIRPIPFLKSKHFFLISFFYLYGLISLLWSVSIPFGGWKIFEMVTVILLIYRIFCYEKFSKNDLNIFNLYIILLSLVVIFVLLSGFLYPNLAFEPLAGSIIPFKLHGSIYSMNSNDLGFYSSLLASIFLYLYFDSKNIKYLFLLTLMILILFLSQSRSFMLILFGVYIYILMIKKKLKLSIFLLFLISIVFYVYFDQIQTNFYEFLTRGDETQVLTLHGRLYYWSIAFEVISEYWLTGLGFYVGHRFLSNAIPSIPFSSPTFDSTWLDIAVDLGIIGIIIISLSLIYLYLDIKKIVNSQLRFILSISLLYLFVRSLTGPSFEVYNLFSILLLVMIYEVSKITRKKNE